MNARPQRNKNDRGTPTRRSQHRPQKIRLQIVCEGKETEHNYFDALKRLPIVDQKFSITVVPGKGGSRHQIVHHAVKRQQSHGHDFDETWCVMDVEHLDTPEAREDLSQAIEIAEAKGILLYLSNPAFEVWLLAHFVRSKRHFNDCDAVIVELNKHWKTVFKSDYEKSDVKNFSKLYDRLKTACENAKAVREKDHQAKASILECNSATELYFIMERFDLHLAEEPEEAKD